MGNRYDYRNEYPPRRRHSPIYSDYKAGSPEYSPTRDAAAVRVAQRHYEYPNRKGQAEVYDSRRDRPREKEYFYEARRSHSRPMSEVYDYDRGREHRLGDHQHHHRQDPSRRKRRHSSGGPNWSQAAIAATSAGIIEAGLSRHDRDRTARVVTAAAGAGAIDAVAGRNNEKAHKSWEHIVGSTVGGLMVDRVAHGSGRR